MKHFRQGYFKGSAIASNCITPGTHNVKPSTIKWHSVWFHQFSPKLQWTPCKQEVIQKMLLSLIQIFYFRINFHLTVPYSLIITAGINDFRMAKQWCLVVSFLQHLLVGNLEYSLHFKGNVNIPPVFHF